MLLGDFVYVSNNDITCSKQIIDAFLACGKTLISINEVPLNQVVHYGIIHGTFDDKDTLMKIDSIVEKPTDDYAKKYLGVKKANSIEKYYATFGQYVLTSDVFEELEKSILSGVPTEGREFGLTSALDIVQKKCGMYGFVPDGKSFDIGLPNAYRDTMINFYN